MTSSGASYVWLCSAYFYPTLFYQLRFHFVGFCSPTDRFESDHLLWKGFYWIMFLLQFHSSFNRIVASDIDIFPDSHASISEGFCLRLCLFELVMAPCNKTKVGIFLSERADIKQITINKLLFFPATLYRRRDKIIRKELGLNQGPLSNHLKMAAEGCFQG